MFTSSLTKFGFNKSFNLTEKDLLFYTDNYVLISKNNYVIANLDKYYNDPVFIIAADTPFVEIDTIKKLSKQKSQIALASDGEFIHYLCGFYSPSVANIARQMIKSKDLRLANLAKICECESIEFGNLKQFFNINTKADYEEANI